MPNATLWVPLVLHGALVMLAGALAVVMPQFATQAVEVMLGVTLIVVACMSVMTYLSVLLYDGAGWFLLWAILSGLAGALILWSPGAAILPLAVVVAAYLAVRGLISTLAAYEFREFVPGAWGWLLLDGLLSLIFANFIALDLPQSAGWTIGTVLGVSLMLFGANLVAFGLVARKLEAR